MKCKGTDERGTISAVGLCALTTILLIGLAAVQFIRGGAGVVSEYEREMQLRLAAESGVETLAARLEQTATAFDPLPSPGETREVDVGFIPMSEKIELHTFVEMPAEGGRFLYVGAAAVDVGGPRIPDGEHWLRAKIVRAQMERKRDRYVWRRWF